MVCSATTKPAAVKLVACAVSALCALLAQVITVEAQESAPLVVVATPRNPSELAREASELTLRALHRFARERTTVVIDLTPEGDPPPRARDHLRRGIDDYQAFKFESALAQLEAGLTEATRTGALGLSPDELSELLIYRALVRTELGDAAQAWEDFVRAVVLDPTRRLDAARFPPRATEPFARAVDQVGAGQIWIKEDSGRSGKHHDEKDWQLQGAGKQGAQSAVVDVLGTDDSLHHELIRTPEVKAE